MYIYIYMFIVIIIVIKRPRWTGQPSSGGRRAFHGQARPGLLQCQG